MKKNIKQFLKAFVLFIGVYFIVKIGVSSLIKFSSDGFHSGKENKALVLEERANTGDAEAMYDLSMSNLKIPLWRGVEVSSSKKDIAFYWANKAYENGSISAITRLACFYENGISVEKDLEKALELYTKALDAGDIEAKVRLALFYTPTPNNKDRQKYVNEEKAKALTADFLKAVDASKNLSIDLYAYAVRSYLEGDLCEKDVAKAVSILEKAYKQNEAKKEYYSKMGEITKALIFCYIRGIGVEKDKAKALDIYNKMQKSEPALSMHLPPNVDFRAYELGLMENISAKEYHELARAYYNSQAGDFKVLYLYDNKAKAKELYEKAGDMGYHLAYSNLAWIIYTYDKDYEKFFSLLNKSYERVGETIEDYEVEILYYLALAYAKGLGTEKDITKAVELYEQASELDNINAHLNLGYMYFDGKDIPKDYKKALEYLLRAERTYKSQQLYTRIAKCYEEQGDISLALDYYKKALNKSSNKERLEAKIKELESELNKKEDL